jgi:hypothetical protein
MENFPYTWATFVMHGDQKQIFVVKGLVIENKFGHHRISEQNFLVTNFQSP